MSEKVYREQRVDCSVKNVNFTKDFWSKIRSEYKALAEKYFSKEKVKTQLKLIALNAKDFDDELKTDIEKSLRRFSQITLDKARKAEWKLAMDQEYLLELEEKKEKK